MSSVLGFVRDAAEVADANVVQVEDVRDVAAIGALGIVRGADAVDQHAGDLVLAGAR